MEVAYEKRKERLVIADGYDVASWAGFRGSDPNVLDGYSMSFQVEFVDGSRIEAFGENKFPKNYHDVFTELDDLTVEAITLWKAKGNLFYLLNFSYIGGCLALGTALFTAGKHYARHFVQLAVGSYMLLYLGVISCENMQIEGFWYYLFLGVFEAATIHYAVAKIFGALFFNPTCSLR